MRKWQIEKQKWNKQKKRQVTSVSRNTQILVNGKVTRRAKRRATKQGKCESLFPPAAWC
jgi:hypothetical protein